MKKRDMVYKVLELLRDFEKRDMSKLDKAVKIVDFSQFGSYIYGSNVPSSDLDYKGLMLPSKRDIILQRAPRTFTENTNNTNTKNSQNDVDYEVFALHYWFKLFIEGQTMCYDMLFTPKQYIIQDHPLWHEIVANKDKLLNSKISAFAGYCQSQAAKYSLKGSNLSSYRLAVDFFNACHPHVKLNDLRETIVTDLINVAASDSKYSDKGEPLIKFVYIEHKVTKKIEEYIQVGPKTKVPMTAKANIAADIFKQQFDRYGERAKMAESNEGVDWKALMHAVRVCEEAKELLLTGNITFPRPEKETLLKIRKGEMPYAQVAEIIVNGLDELHLAKEKTILRSEPDTKWIEDFIFETYKNL